MMAAGLDELATLIDAACPARPRVVSLSGGGGKTSALFALARLYAGRGLSVVVTATTRILDPRLASEREGRGFGNLILEQLPGSGESLSRIRGAGPAVVLGSRVEGEKLYGIDPDAAAALAELFDIVLVEADGAAGRPIKAPAAHEPVVPPATRAAIGVIGLDAPGRPMDGRMVHRPEIFGPLVGCAPGEAITATHLARLVASPQGLFKGVPAGASRIALLNKADAAARELARSCAEAVASCGGADAVVVGALGVPSREEAR